MKTALILTTALLSGTAVADTLYKCTDRSTDAVLFTNQQVNGKHCVILSKINPGPGYSSSTTRKASSTPTPNDFPRVSSDTQRERDSGRRTILEQELNSEQRNLDEARKASNSNKAQLHERNITALQKEIANLK